LLAFALYATHDVFIKMLGETFAPFQIVFFSTLLSFPLITLMLMRDRTKRHADPGASLVDGAADRRVRDHRGHGLLRLLERSRWPKSMRSSSPRRC
jgi:hypothetical protein